MKIKDKLKEHIYFTKAERRGIFAFFIVTIFVIGGFKYFSHHNYKASKDLEIYGYQLDTVSDSKPYPNNSKNYWDPSNPKQYQKVNRKVYEKFEFDPNTCSKDSLLNLGFREFMVNNIIKYREKGGYISSLSKFKEIYGIDTSLIESLSGYIKIAPQIKPDYQAKNYDRGFKIQTKEEEEMVLVELNSADSLELLKIKGIGPFYAKKILSMRSKMGGFIDPEQLVELNIVSDSMFQIIKDQIMVNRDEMGKLDINTVNYKQLIQHPYFDKNKVQVLLNYRQNHGPFKSLNELKRIKAFNEQFYNQILPYFKVAEN